MFKYQLLKIIPSLITLLNFGVIYAGFEWSEPEPLLMKNGEQIKSVSSYYNNEPQIALGDWDNDGDLDLIYFEVLKGATFNTSADDIFYLLINSGTPKKYSFNERVEMLNVKAGDFQNKCIAQGLQIVDINNDGKSDLAFTETSGGNPLVKFYEGDGSHEVLPYNPIKNRIFRFFGQRSFGVSHFIDIDNDKDKDLFWIEDVNIKIFSNSSNGNENVWEGSIEKFEYVKNVKNKKLEIPGSSINCSLSDLDGDDDLDLIIWGNQTDSSNPINEWQYPSYGIGTVYENHGDFKYEKSDTVISVKETAVRGTTGDLNNDGIVDVIILKDKKLFVVWGKGSTDIINYKSLVLKNSPSIQNNTLILSKDVKNCPAEIALISINGRTVTNIKTSHTHIDLGKISSVSRGMYIVNVKFNNKSYSLLWNRVGS